MWRTKDFDEVGRHLRRLRGILPSGNLFEIARSGAVEKIASDARERTQVASARDRDDARTPGIFF